jgi:hypothetical protein
MSRERDSTVGAYAAQKTYGEKIRWTKQQAKSDRKKSGLVRWGK